MSELSPEQRANLVAYLDGELSEDAVVEIEELLADSPEARAEVEKLSSTWDMLDDLAQPTASPGFSENTLATVKIAEIEAAKHRWLSPGARRGAIAVAWIVALVFSAMLGFFVTNHWIPNPANQLAKELPLIENLHVYSEIESVEFLSQLRDSELFNDDGSDDSNE